MTVEKLHDALTLLPSDLIAEVDKKRSGRPKAIVWKRYIAMAACFAIVLCSGWFCIILFGARGGSSESIKEMPAEAAVMQASGDTNGSGADAALSETQAAAVYEEAGPEAEAPAAKEETLSALPASPEQESASMDTQTDTTSENGTATTTTLYAGMSRPKYVNTPPNLSGSACFVTPSPKLILSRADLDAYLNKTPPRFLLDELAEVCEDYDDAWFETHDLLLIPLCTVPADDLPEVTAIQEQDGQWNICIENYRQYYAEDAQPEYTDVHILMEVDKGLIPDGASIMLIYE